MNIFLLAGRAIFTVLVFTLVACSTGGTPEEHLAKARQYISDSKNESATLELKSALQKDNTLGEARWLLGKIYLDAGDVLSAEKELQLALKLNWSPDDVLPALAQSLLALEKYSEVASFSTRELQSAGLANVLASKALAAAALGEHKKSARLIDQALSVFPDSVPALLAKARILTNRGELTLASDITLQLTSVAAENAAVWNLLGDIRTAQRDSREAIRAFDRAIALQKNDFLSRFKRSLLLLETGDFEAAHADAAELLKRAPGHPGASYVQGIIQFREGSYPDAIASLTAAEPAFGDLPLALLFLGSAQLLENDLDQAAIYASRFQSVAPQSIQGAKLLANVRMRQSRYREVQVLLAPVLEVSPEDIESLKLMANALLRDGKTDQGIELLFKVAKLQPDSADAQTMLGAGLLMGGKNEDASQYIESALQLDPSYQEADILLIMNHLLRLDYDAAIRSAQAFRKRNPLSTTALNMLGKAYQAAGRESKALETFALALALDEGDPAANQNLAQMALDRDDNDSAGAHYEAILKHHENYLPALLRLALLAADERDGLKMVKYLERAIEAHPDAVEPKLLMARYFISEGRPEKVAPIFTDLNAGQKKLPDVLQLMALAQLSINDSSNARYTLEQLLSAEPDNASTHHLMAVAAAQTGDALRSQAQIMRALQLDANHVPARIAAAKLALSRSRIEEFSQHLDRLESLSPGNPEVLLLQAAAAQNDGDVAKAITLAEKAFILAPAPATLKALAIYTEVGGDRAGSQQLFRTWLSQIPDDSEVTLALAQSLQSSNNAAEAVRLYEKLLVQNPENVTALNNLAWMLRETDPAKALVHARRASDLVPQSADVLDTLAVAEYWNKDYKQAMRNVDRALDQRPDDPVFIYHRSMIQVAQGETARAKENLTRLLARTTEFAEFEKAKALLNSLQ